MQHYLISKWWSSVFLFKLPDALQQKATNYYAKSTLSYNDVMDI